MHAAHIRVVPWANGSLHVGQPLNVCLLFLSSYAPDVRLVGFSTRYVFCRIYAATPSYWQFIALDAHHYLELVAAYPI